MRVSPALLASFSLVAIAGLPSQAADAAETANSATSIEAQGVEVQGVEVQGVESQGIEAQGPTLDTALGAVQSADGPSLARLLNGAAAANKAWAAVSTEATGGVAVSLVADTSII